MTELLKERRASADARLAKLAAALEATARDIDGKACVYVTGSFGRGEASDHSDLDVFIVGLPLPDAEGDKTPKRELSRLEEICAKADLIRAASKQGFPKFTDDGAYLEHCTVQTLVGKLGSEDDDVLNTFTARLLLLLESKCLLGKTVHDQAIHAAIGAYWRDYSGHEQNFQPAFLANDILRFWRTLCVNYEARTQTEPAEKKTKRKLKNYGLKHSRLLTCYSALMYLLAVVSSEGTVSPEVAFQMTRLMPTERLEALPRLSSKAKQDDVARILTCYEKFLRETDAPETELLLRFQDASRASAYMQDARLMGDAVHALLSAIGANSDFYRLLVV